MVDSESPALVTHWVTSKITEEMAEQFFQKDLKNLIRNETPCIYKGVEYLKSSRFPDGSWQESGWHTALAIRALFRVGEPKDSYFLKDGVMWLLRTQEKNDGSWSHQIWETAHVLIALLECKKVWEKWGEEESISANEIEQRIKNALQFIEIRANWSESRGDWQGKKWTWTENSVEIKAHSYDVAMATRLFLLIFLYNQQVNMKLVRDSVDYLIEQLAMKEKIQPKTKEPATVLLNWDHNVLNTAIVVDMLAKIAPYFSKENRKYIQNMLEAVNYLFNRRVPESKGWGDSRHTAEAVVALYSALDLLEKDEITEYKDHIQEIKKSAAEGVQELKELQMPNGSWYGRVESTATAIFALLAKGEKSFDQATISMPANILERIKNVWEKKIQDYAWELDRYKAGIRSSPDFQEMSKNLQKMQEDLEKERFEKERCKSSKNRFFILSQVLFLVCAFFIISTAVLLAKCGYIPSDFANPITAMAILGEILSFWLVFRMHKE